MLAAVLVMVFDSWPEIVEASGHVRGGIFGTPRAAEDPLAVAVEAAAGASKPPFIVTSISRDASAAGGATGASAADVVADVRNSAGLLAMDIASAVLVILAGAYRLRTRLTSADRTAAIVGGLSSIPWDSELVPLADKKASFFAGVLELLALVEEDAWSGRLANAALLVSLLRVIQCTALHPRLALLTGTVAAALDDLWHTGVLSVFLMACFAGIGKWRFGAEMKAFSTMDESLRTGFNLMFTATAFDGWTKVPPPIHLVLFIPAWAHLHVLIDIFSV